jgi:hypothetical protein
MKSLKDIFDKEKFLKKFKVRHKQSLFMHWEMLSKDRPRCPICCNLLKFPQDKDIAYCKGKKHKKVFVISTNVLKRNKFIFK